MENCYYNNVRYDVVRVVEVSIVFSLIFLVGLMGVQSSFAIPESFAQEEGMCAPQNYKRIVKNAGAIFTGTVISKEPLMQQYYHNVHFKIDELLLGDYENFLNVTTSERRTVGSEPRGGDPFEVGEKYMVFARSIENNTLYAGSSGCGDSLVIPMLSGLFGFGVGKNCSASVHLECLDRCGINFSSYGNTAECLQVCYKRNSDQCLLKPEPISEPEKDTSEQIDSNLPPLKQISSGTLPENVTCTEGLKLIFKYDNSPACVKSESIPKLIERGWAKLKENHIEETSIYEEKFPAQDFSYQKVVQKLEKNEDVFVIVMLNTDNTPFDNAKDNLELKKQIVSELQEIVLANLPSPPDTSIKKFKYVPGFAIKLNQASLDYLVNSPFVTGIFEDKEEPLLEEDLFIP